MTNTAQPFTPFAFVTDTGLFSTPELSPLISEHALTVLEQAANTPTATAPEKSAIAALLAAVAQLPVKKRYSSTKRNDVHPSILRVSDYPELGHQFDGSEKSHRCLVTLGAPRSNFQLDRPHARQFTDQPSTWGWSAVLPLKPHLKVLAHLAKKHEITLSGSLLKKTIQNYEDFSNDTLKIRVKSAEVDLARGPAWVVYLPDNQTYADAQWRGVSISAARLFESSAAAQKSIAGRGLTGKASVVEVGISITKIEISAGLSAETAAPLQEALSLIEREQIVAALNSCDIESLRQRVKELEEAQGVVPAPSPAAKSKRM